MFKNTNVKELSVSDFDDKGNLPNYKGKVLVLFYAEWCGHCQHFKPEYIELSKNKEGNYFSLNMSNVDEMTRKKMKDWKFNVQGFPTIVGFFNGQPYSIYQGDRTKENLMSYVNNIGKKWNV